MNKEFIEDSVPKSKVTWASVSPLQLTGDHLTIARGLLYCRATTIATQEIQAWIFCGRPVCHGGEGLSTQESAAIVQMCVQSIQDQRQVEHW